MRATLQRVAWQSVLVLGTRAQAGVWAALVVRPAVSAVRDAAAGVRHLRV